jgi:(1->4)-alpha-D-glucan 1-alpha-D-glucosylmutase
MIIGKHLAGNIDNLAHFLKNITSNDRDATDITLFSLKRALTEVFVFFPVYRTYVNANTFSEVDKRYIQQAIDIAKENRPYLLNELNFLQKFILFENADTLDQENRNKRMNFIMNFQQYSGPLMAKGFEDTVLYIYNRLISLNEVGGHPEYFGISLETFHGFCKEMSEKWPHSLCATSTHDTKRGEDARSRINVLSEIPRDWAAHIKKWTAYNRKYKKKMGDSLVPDKNDEYFIYQTLIGTYPFDGRLDDYKKRLQEYMIKSVREAKVHTAWITNDSEYENACTNFIEQILKAGENNLFLNDFLSFHKITSFYGILNSLSQTLIKLTVPGVPDFYQGCELWDFSFVDPDNRRQVDYAMRMTMLEEIKAKANQDMAALLIDLLNTFQDGRIKLYLVHVLLEFRKNHLQLFESGAYIPIEIEGTFKENIVAFIRKTENKTALMIAPRFYSYFTKAGEMNNASDAWGDTTLLLPETVWPLHVQSIITGRNIYLENKKTLISNILTDFPLNAFVNT